MIKLKKHWPLLMIIGVIALSMLLLRNQLTWMDAAAVSLGNAILVFLLVYVLLFFVEWLFNVDLNLV